MVRRFSCRANTLLAVPLRYSLAQRNTHLQYCPPLFGNLVSRPFSATSRYLTAEKTHYEVLGIATTATPAEIKKKFYALSRETHPDIHPNDETAAARFASISESYHVLADTDKRKRYDRDVIHPRQRAHNAHHHHGSHHSGSYAGSRPASGLSRRRSAFRGPPPSFYTQGGYGTNTDRASTASANAQAQSQRGTSDHQGQGQGQPNESTRHNPNDTSTGPRPFTEQPLNQDFDPSSTRRTQAAEDTRRMSRREAQLARAQEQAADEQDFWVRVVVVFGIFIGSAALAGVIRARHDVTAETEKNGKSFMGTRAGTVS